MSAPMQASFANRYELLNPDLRRGGYRAAVFDFDGTLSLLREGWARIMAELGRDLLQEQNIPLEENVCDVLELAMLKLSGKPSIFQMQRLAEELTTRGGIAGDPKAYLAEFHQRLFKQVNAGKQALQDGSHPPHRWTVPGAHRILQGLQDQGVALALASGTDLSHVKEELKLLQLDHFFGEDVFAPDGDLAPFTKREAITHFLNHVRVPSHCLVGFGDGFAETVEVKALGGTTVGLAGREAGQPGWNELKRTMLKDLNADLLITDYEPAPVLIRFLWGG